VEGNTFCGQCGAPQIRVMAPGDALDQPGAAPSIPHPVQTYIAPPQPRIAWNNAAQKAMLVGLLSVLVLEAMSRLLPGLLVYLLGLPAAGAFAVWLYHRSTRQELTGGMGARIGAVTGLFGFLVNMLVAGAMMKARPGAMSEEFKRGMQEALKNNPDPNAQQMMQKLMSPEGIALMLTIGVVFLLVIFLVLCSLGGLMGASLTREERR
jgi:hypothetical protein